MNSPRRRRSRSEKRKQARVAFRRWVLEGRGRLAAMASHDPASIDGAVDLVLALSARYRTCDAVPPGTIALLDLVGAPPIIGHDPAVRRVMAAIVELLDARDALLTSSPSSYARVERFVVQSVLPHQPGGVA